MYWPKHALHNQVHTTISSILNRELQEGKYFLRKIMLAFYFSRGENNLFATEAVVVGKMFGSPSTPTLSCSLYHKKNQFERSRFN